jgi:hypothetical protein
MKTKTIAVIAALGLLPMTGFAQTPPAPPNPPIPPTSPNPPLPPYSPKDHDRDKGPKVAVTFLGVETSSVPRVVSEQLGLAKGFGLVVDYVVPEGPAAAAGVQQSDILKMLNDQILMEPDQLSKLIRSYSEGTSVTLTILRKGAETKVTVKLGKREVPSRNNMFDPGHDRHRDKDTGFNYQFNMPDMENLREEMSNIGPRVRDAVREARREAMRARAEALKAARQVRMATNDAAGRRSTTIDLARAVIVSTDAQGELKIEKVDGKKVLTAKDPQGRLIFSGPIDTKEELDKVPAEVRQRYEKLEHKDLPGVMPFASNNRTEETDNDGNNDNDNDADEDDNSDEDDSSSDAADAAMQQVSLQAFPRSFHRWNTVSF